MGEVYRATDSHLKRSVAIKVLPASVAGDTDRLARFQREAEVLAALNHPNIAAIYGLEKTADFTALVMEVVEGEDLSAHIARGAIPFGDALPIARQIADALEAAHAQGIIHRDLKPANIKVRADGTVKVLDFGLAKAIEPADTTRSGGSQSPTMTSPAMTQMGMILGTAAYMSPEQARGRPVDKRTDIWAFGAVLYEMLTGARAFDGEDVTEMIAAVVKTTPNWTELPADVPPHIVALIQRCLEKDRKSRVGDIAVARFLLAGHVTLGNAPTAAPSAPAPRPARARALPWVVAGVMTTAAALAGFFYIRQPETAAPEVMRFGIQAPADAPFELHIRISPDGRTVAFPATGGGDTRRRLWVRALNSLETRPLPGTEGTTGGLFWLPDSRTLVFSSGGKLKKIDVLGGPAQSICDFGNDVGGGFLTADNRIVFGTPATRGILTCPAGGGEAVSVTAFKAGGQETYHAFPTLLPDGRHFLFWRSAGPESGIYVGSLGTKPDEQTATRVLPDSSAPVYVAGPDGGAGRLLFVRDGTLMAQSFDAGTLALSGDAVPVGEDLRNSYGFSASRDATLVYLTSAGSNVQLTWYDRQGKRLETVGRGGSVLANLRISLDGTQLAATRRDSGAPADVWVVDLVQGTETRLTTVQASDTVPVWSADGKRLVFSSDREGTTNLYVRAADGAGQDELLLKTGERKAPLDWSRDGKFLLFSVSAPRSPDIWVLPMEAGPGGVRKPVPYLRTDSIEGSARFSPDGRFVAYTSDESGSIEVYVQPFDAASPEASGTGGGRVRVSPTGGANPAWNSNGRELVYLTPDRKLWSVDVTLTPALRVGAPRLLSELPRGNGVMTPDGQRILVGVPVGEEQPGATVVLNWQAGLKPATR
jgi:Tol biopolymer transport system component